MKRLLVLALLVFLACYAAPTHAADRTVGESLEWLILSRPNIAIAEVTSTSPGVNPATNYLELTIQTRVKQILKGEPPQEASFVRRWQETAAGQGDAARPENGTEYLLFYTKNGMVTNAINLKFPSRKLGVGVTSADVAVSADFTVLKDGELIMDLVRRYLALLPTDPNAVPAASQQVEIPIDAPAWDIFYEGRGCDLIIPKNLDKIQGTPITRTAVFSGPAFGEECETLPRKPFEIKSASAAQPNNVLTLKCVYSKEVPEGQEKLLVSFKVKDVAREANYDFRWISDPDSKAHEPRFHATDPNCELLARVLRVRAMNGNTVPLTAVDPSAENGSPMNATATAKCVSDDVWGVVMAFELKARFAPKNQPADESANPAAPPAPQPAGATPPSNGLTVLPPLK